MWFPYNGKPNQICFNCEKHMKYSIIDLDGENEPVIFTNNVMGTISQSIFWGNLKAQESPFSFNSVTSQIENYS